MLPPLTNSSLATQSNLYRLIKPSVRSSVHGCGSLGLFFNQIYLKEDNKLLISLKETQHFEKISTFRQPTRNIRRGATSTVYFVLPSYVMIFVFGRISILDFFFLKQVHSNGPYIGYHTFRARSLTTDGHTYGRVGEVSYRKIPHEKENISLLWDQGCGSGLILTGPDPDPTSQDNPDPDTSVLKIFHLFYDEF